MSALKLYKHKITLTDLQDYDGEIVKEAEETDDGLLLENGKCIKPLGEGYYMDADGGQWSEVVVGLFDKQGFYDSHADTLGYAQI